MPKKRMCLVVGAFVVAMAAQTGCTSTWSSGGVVWGIWIGLPANEAQQDYRLALRTTELFYEQIGGRGTEAGPGRQMPYTREELNLTFDCLFGENRTNLVDFLPGEENLYCSSEEVGTNLSPDFLEVEYALLSPEPTDPRLLTDAEPIRASGRVKYKTHFERGDEYGPTAFTGRFVVPSQD